jgi:Mg2+ and Co2+ transporter CorA
VKTDKRKKGVMMSNPPQFSYEELQSILTSLQETLYQVEDLLTSMPQTFDNLQAGLATVTAPEAIASAHQSLAHSQRALESMHDAFFSSQSALAAILYEFADVLKQPHVQSQVDAVQRHLNRGLYRYNRLMDRFSELQQAWEARPGEGG